MNSLKHSKRSGFTLIEMLVVIAIIAILAGLLFPAIGRALETAKRNQAAAEVRSIASAITVFYNDYGYLPDRLDAQGLQPYTGNSWSAAAEDAPGFFNEEVSRRIIQVLIAEPAGANTGHELNPRRKVYLSMPNVKSSGEVLDPWREQYRIKLDRDLDGRIEYHNQPNQHRTRAVVVSGGRSQNVDNVSDNIANVDLSN